MPNRAIQLSLFDWPPSPPLVAEPPAAAEGLTPASDPPPSPAVAAPPPHPTFQQVEQTCTEFMRQGNRAALLGYLNQLCEQGFCEWVQKFCRLRIDFGLKVEGRGVVEFFQVGDIVCIHQQGQFYGKIVPLIALVNGIATVRGENWVVEHRYSVADIRLVRRRKDAQTD